MKASPGLNPSTAETGGAAVCLRHLGSGDKRIGSTGSSSTTLLPGSLGTEDCLSMRCNEVQEHICLLLLCSLGQGLPTSAWNRLYTLTLLSGGFQVCITMPSPILQQYTVLNLCVTFRTRQNYSCLYSEISNKCSILDLKHSFFEVLFAGG